jgi:uncharacterized phage infection (PIP) family protein YhgE
MSIETPDEARTASQGAGNSVPETAKDVASHAGEQAKHVADQAKDQAREVAAETKDHAREILDQARTQARQQAEDSTKHLARGLHSLGDQIQALREGRAQDAGAIADYADQAKRKLENIAGRLDHGGINGVASELTSFARRRPGLFLVSCAGAGFALARLVRGGTSDPGDGDRAAPNRSYALGAHASATNMVDTAVPEAEADPGLPVGVSSSGVS